MPRGYGLEELVDALVDARAGRPEACLALAGALGADLERVRELVDGTFDRDHDGYGWLLDRVVSALSERWSPFEGLMEAPPGVIRLYRHHGEPVARRTARAREAVRDVGADALVFLLGVPRDAHVRGAEAAKLDVYFREPDPDDW